MNTSAELRIEVERLRRENEALVRGKAMTKLLEGLPVPAEKLSQVRNAALEEAATIFRETMAGEGKQFWSEACECCAELIEIRAGVRPSGIEP